MFDADEPQPHHDGAPDLFGYLIGPIFLALAAWFALGPETTRIPDAGMVVVEAADITSAPVRELLDPPPTASMGGYDLKCMECHRLFESLPETARRLTQHTHIVLDHGLNDRCFNCHDNADRDRFALPGVKTLPFEQVSRLCATCHGTTFRDWEHGMHGRITGAWDVRFGPRHQLQCTNCHDPHQPAFPPMGVLPGPNTLRMGEPGVASHEEEGQRNPLRTWQHGPSGAGHDQTRDVPGEKEEH